jgi:hypothetical protein
LGKELATQATLLDQQFIPALRVLQHNEEVTRARVAHLESWLNRSCWDRWRWLLVGR